MVRSTGNSKSDKSHKNDKTSAETASSKRKAARNKKKREKRKLRVQQFKKAARLSSAAARAQGLPAPKPCHLCHERGHWSQDCDKYGAWKVMMDNQKAS